MKDKLAFAVAAASTVGTLYLIPSWHGFLTDPCLWGYAGAIATVVILLITRHLGDRARLFEVRWLAIFLAAMPLIYVARWLLTGAQGYGWMLVELGGVVAYATFAVAGLKNHWFLAAGITAHGLAWDIWHLFPGSSYIPSWYALGMLDR